MSTAMFDAATTEDRRPNPALLAKGSLVYLWAPGERPWELPCRPILARVEKATTHSIVGIDLRDSARAVYDVTRELITGPAQSWTWELAAPPQRAAVVDGVEHIDGGRLTLEQRVALICGAPGGHVRFSMRDGSSMSGVLSAVLSDDPEAVEADWFEVVGPLDSAGRQIKHWGRVGDIVSVTRTHE